MDFESALGKIKDILSDSSDKLEDVVDFLYSNFDYYNWVGIYVVEENNLILKAWKGLQATEHIIIPIGSGVCGSAVTSKKTELVSDVNKDDRYLSCFVSTKSEIVVPIFRNRKVIAEIDIDSDKINAFSEKDSRFLERIADMLSLHI